MNKTALEHIPKSNYAFPTDENTLCVRFRTAKNDVDKIYVIYSDKFLLHKNETQKVLMDKILSDKLFDYYETKITTPHNRYVYYFEILKGEEKIYFGDYGIFKPSNEKLYFDVFQFPYIHKRDVHEIPSWTSDAIFYQIFPDRFYRVENENSSSKNLTSWGNLPMRKSFYGGNLKGIIEKLDYIEELGINAIYLTPIFKAPSNHKYDTTDYFQIDDNFGSKEEFKKLVDEAHLREIRIILDCVFNHSGYTFEPFQDVIKHGKKFKVL